MAGPIKIVVCGAMGRMGQKVIQTVSARSGMTVIGAVEHPGNPLLGQNIGPLVGVSSNLVLTSNFAEAAKGADLYIDFTAISASLGHLAQAAELGVGAVIGTTGFSKEEQKELTVAADKIPVIWAPNMSTGVNVLYKIAAAMTRALGPDYDIEIVETHHRHKKDAPSGTALRILETVAKARGLDDPAGAMVTGRQGQTGERAGQEIGVLALRGGDVVGDHTIHFCGPGERLELTHRAQSRDTFAEGAVRAAAWLAGKAPGLYTIDDTINIDS